MRKPLKVFLFLFVTSIYSINAQHYTHDVGLFVGVGSIQTDYGQRDNYLSSYGNTPISISLTHYLHFFNRELSWKARNSRRFFSYTMIKSELNIMTEESFEHHGKYANNNSLLKAMKGSISMITAGVSLEFYLKDLKEFSSYYSHQGQICHMRENSNFIMENNQWRYLDGDVSENSEIDKPKRNQLCFCGSAKKFKQCCAKVF